jgi:hypothetical protein
MVWLVTISCYGSHLPGDSRGSYDHVRQGQRRCIPPSPALETYARKLMLGGPFVLADSLLRRTVLEAIIDVCQFRDWPLLALHIRTSHFHGVVDCASPELVLRDWKSYSTRALHRLPGEPRDRHYWTRGGNYSALQSQAAIRAAIGCVLEQQGEPLEHYHGEFREEPCRLGHGLQTHRLHTRPSFHFLVWGSYFWVGQSALVHFRMPQV